MYTYSKEIFDENFLVRKQKGQKTMELISIRQISSDYGISRQMLSYYEEIGLIKSSRKNDSAYRLYDEDAIKRLQQIIILRKLQIPMKQIKNILDNPNAVKIIEIFNQNINELDEQITALSVVKSILTRLVDELQEKADIRLNLDILNDKTMLAVASSLSFSENKINKSPTLLETKGNVIMETMENLNKANETLSKLKDSDVRIIYLPPMTVAVAHGLTEDETTVKGPAIMAEKFDGLFKIKPDARLMMAWNYSKEKLKALMAFDSKEEFKSERTKRIKEYEMWVTIPDDMEVPAPLTKKTFEGGLYAVRNGYFDDMRFLVEWVNASERYEAAYERPFLQEFLNYYYHVYIQGLLKTEDLQNKYLLPIKKITE